jgi:trigger factor
MPTQIEVKNLPKSEILVTIEVSPEDLAKFEDQAAARISEEVEIPGFRKGQAPKAFVIAKIGADAFFQEVLNVALPRTYFEAVKERNLQVVSRPEVKVITKSPLKYEAKVAVLPEITIKGYENIKIKKGTIKITEKEIDEIVEEMRKYRATYKPLERAIKKGDRLEIDFQGYDEGGAALDKTQSKNHPLFVGEGSLVTGFEDQLLGMKTGDKKKFPVTFPKDFHYEPLRNKKVQFDVEVKKAEEPILPALNEDFVAQVMGERKEVPEFKAAIKEDLNRKKVVEARRNQENELLEKLIKDAKLDVPQMLIEEEIDYMIMDLKRELDERSMPFDTYMEKIKKEGRDLRKEYAVEAEKRIRLRLVLNFLFRTLAIDATDEEIKTASVALLERTPEKEKEYAKKQLESKGELYMRLKNNLMLEKLFAKFLE